ncbi:MAG: hypothetical protein HYU00_06125 [Nitrosarchaeum sp.]|nr:hypothetical protein [Nitrosarchaeum sp.]
MFSILVTGLVANSAFAEETTVDMTDSIDMAESSNSTSTETTTTESNSTSTEDETMVVEDEMTISEDEMVETEDETMESEVETMEEMTPTILSPLKQIKEGTMPENIVCKEGLGLVFKLTGQPACVKTTSIEKLIAWGWAR